MSRMGQREYSIWAQQAKGEIAKMPYIHMKGAVPKMPKSKIGFFLIMTPSDGSRGSLQKWPSAITLQYVVVLILWLENYCYKKLIEIMNNYYLQLIAHW